MATESKLKDDIKKLETALNSKATSEKIKPKLKNQLAILKAELSALQKPAASKMSRAKQLRAKYKALYGVRFQGIDIEKDADIPARAIGKRTSQGLKGNQYASKKQAQGNTYYEYRENRIDMKQPPKKYPKLEDGGYMAKGGEISDIDKAKKSLIAKAKAKGLYEDFGQKEVRQLEEKYGYTAAIRNFDNWAMNFDLSQMEDGGMMADGGKVAKEYKLVPMIPYGVKGMITTDYKSTQRFMGTEDEAVAKAKELANSNPNFVRVEIKRELKTKTNTVGIVDGQNKNYADGGMMAKGGKVDYGSLYQKIIKAVQRDLKISKEDATDLVDKNEAFIVDMIDYEGITSPNQIADAITSDYGEAEYKKGGMSQGYDDREDERLAMKYGKIKSKYLNSTKARRDDARFEERMEDGGMMADGGAIDSDVFDKLKKGDKIHIIYPRGQNFVEKELLVKSKNLVGKGKSYESEKITFTDVSNPNGVNFFAYKRKSGFVGFAQGDSGMPYVQIKDKMADGGEITKEDCMEIFYVMDGSGKVKSMSSKRDNALSFLQNSLKGDGRLSSRVVLKKDWENEKINTSNIKDYKEPNVGFYSNDEIWGMGKYADGGMMAEGGEVNGDNMEMVVSQIKAIKHHAEELSKIVTSSTPIEAWVVAKIERAETDLSDVTHYLDGLKMEHGGKVSSSQHRLNR